MTINNLKTSNFLTGLKRATSFNSKAVYYFIHIEYDFLPLEKNPPELIAYFISSSTYQPIASKIRTIEANESDPILGHEHKALNYSRFQDSLILACFKLFENSSVKKDEVLFYIHHLNDAIGFFILDFISRRFEDYEYDIIRNNSCYYQIILWNTNDRKKKIIFRDSSLIFVEDPQILEKISNLKQIPKQDLILEPEDGELRKELTNRCYDKLHRLCDIVHVSRLFFFKTYNVDPINCVTISSLAFNCFRMFHYSVKKNPIAFLNKDEYDFISKSYMGGVCEVYKPLITNGFYYDVNSLYPYVMSKYEYPIDKGKTCSLDDETIKNFFGYVEVDVTAPNLYIPFLYQKLGQSMVAYSNTSWSGVYFSEEIKYALTLGYKFKYGKAIAYSRSDKLFTSYVEENYGIKETSENYLGLKKVPKLMLNSLYGRFGMKEKVTNIIAPSFPNTYDFNDLVSRVEGFSNNMTLFGIKNEKDHLSTVQIASAISSYGRIEIDKIKRLPGVNLYYSDTDSIVTDTELDPYFVHQTEIGKLKLVYKIEKALFLAPKFYYILTKSDEKKCILKSKGIKEGLVSVEDMDFLYNNTELSIDIIQDNFNDKSCTFESTQTEMKTKYTLWARDLKRVKVFKNGLWVDTLPFNRVQ